MAQVTKLQILKPEFAPYDVAKAHIIEYVKEFSNAKMTFLDCINK